MKLREYIDYLLEEFEGFKDTFAGKMHSELINQTRKTLVAPPKNEIGDNTKRRRRPALNKKQINNPTKRLQHIDNTTENLTDQKKKEIMLDALKKARGVGREFKLIVDRRIDPYIRSVSAEKKEEKNIGKNSKITGGKISRSDISDIAYLDLDSLYKSFRSGENSKAKMQIDLFDKKIRDENKKPNSEKDRSLFKFSRLTGALRPKGNESFEDYKSRVKDFFHKSDPAVTAKFKLFLNELGGNSVGSVEVKTHTGRISRNGELVNVKLGDYPGELTLRLKKDEDFLSDMKKIKDLIAFLIERKIGKKLIIQTPEGNRNFSFSRKDFNEKLSDVIISGNQANLKNDKGNIVVGYTITGGNKGKLTLSKVDRDIFKEVR